MQIKLFHMHSTIVDGFYASEVYVAAPDKDAAEEIAFDTFLEWLDDQIADWCFPCGLDPEDDDYNEKRNQVIKTFSEELTARLQPVPGPYPAAILTRE